MTGDAGRYRRLYVNDWHRPAFRALNNDARIVYLYVIAGPQTTSCGCFRLSTAVAVEDLGGTAEDFDRRLDLVCEHFSWARDPLSRVIWIGDWFEQNPPASPNVVASWAKLLKNVPDCDLKFAAIAHYAKALKDLPATFREPFAELSKTFPRSEIQPQIRPETYQGSGNLRTEKERTRDEKHDDITRGNDAAERSRRELEEIQRRSSQWGTN